MKHGYTDDTLQDAIDAACEETAKAHEIYLNALDLKPSSQSWAEETPARLHLAEKLLELLPEDSQLSTLRPIAHGKEWTPAVGDVVMLKSGGPKMTIMSQSLNDDDEPIAGTWLCGWIDGYGSTQTWRKVHATCLQPAKGEQP